MPPLVSIIITNYNYGRFLGEAIESALAQTWQHKEVIVLDDESRDDSLDVACRYPITVIAQKNSGLSLARNNALTLAQGDYVIFVDADDRLVLTAVVRFCSGRGNKDRRAMNPAPSMKMPSGWIPISFMSVRPFPAI